MQFCNLTTDHVNCGQLCLKKKHKTNPNQNQTNPEIPNSTAPLGHLSTSYSEGNFPWETRRNLGQDLSDLPSQPQAARSWEKALLLPKLAWGWGMPTLASHSSPQPPPTKPACDQLYRTGARNKESQTVRQSLQCQKVYLAFKKNQSKTKQKEKKKETSAYKYS